MDNPIFSPEPLTDREAWIWLIEKASYLPSKMRHKNSMINLGRGEVPTSYRRLQDEWKWGVHRVCSFLRLLEEEGMIIRKIETGFLIITLCNYEKYQDSLKKYATQATTLAITPTATLATTNRTKGKLKGTKEEDSLRSSSTPVVPKQKKPANGYPPGFEDFRSAYPPNGGSKKKDAESYQKAIANGASHEQLLEAAGAYARYTRATGSDPHHTAHASTWLNQQRWETDYAAIMPRNPTASHSGTHGGTVPTKIFSTGDNRDPAARARDEAERIIAKRRAERTAIEIGPGGAGPADALAITDLCQPAHLRRQSADDGIPGPDVPVRAGQLPHKVDPQGLH